MKNNNKFEKINPRNNISNFLSRFYRQMESKIFYNRAHFIDANFLIKIDNDKRYKIFNNVFKNFYITEPIFEEANLGSNNWGKILNQRRLKIIKFEEIRKKFPAACSLYYNFISGMYNPANICSPDFIANLLFSIKEKDKFSKGHEIIDNKIIGNFNKLNKKETNILGEKKSDWENYINRSFLNQIKKKKKSLNISNSNFLNDYKNLSLILIYTLLNRTNSFFITADMDVFYNLSTWAESMAHQSSFKSMLLEQMGRDSKSRILKGEKLVYFIDYDIFKKRCDGILVDLISHDWKKRRFTITIKYWDTEKQKFCNQLKVSFNDLFREMLLNEHGQFYCPFSPNNSYGNFFRYEYHWPPISVHDFNTIKVSVHRKRLICRSPQNASEFDHIKYCKFNKAEKEGDLKDFVKSFRVAG